MDRKVAKARARARPSSPPLSNRTRRIGGQLNRLHRPKTRKREAAAHRHSRRLADTAPTVVLEAHHGHDPEGQGHGGGTGPERPAEGRPQPGRRERRLAYKAGALLKVNPAYTSQTCAVCGHVGRENRGAQAAFQCTANAALNILARGLPLARPARLGHPEAI